MTNLVERGTHQATKLYEHYSQNLSKLIPMLLDTSTDFDMFADGPSTFDFESPFTSALLSDHEAT